MDLRNINFIACNVLFRDDSLNKLRVNKVYKIIAISREKKLFGSLINVTLEGDIKITVPSLRPQRLFEENHYMYYDLVKNMNMIYVKYLGYKKIEFVNEV